MKYPLLLQVRWDRSRETILIELSDMPKVGDLFTTTELWDGCHGQVEYTTRVLEHKKIGTAHRLRLEYSENENQHILADESCWGVSTLDFDTKTMKCAAVWANNPPDKEHDGKADGAKLISASSGVFLGYAAALKLKRKQELFKRSLLGVVNVCELTGEGELCVLDAAHIVEVKDMGSHGPTNGLLLRSDIHRLFDRRLMHINPKDGRVSLSSDVPEESGYHDLVKGLRLSAKSLQRVRRNLAKRKDGG